MYGRTSGAVMPLKSPRKRSSRTIVASAWNVDRLYFPETDGFWKRTFTADEGQVGHSGWNDAKNRKRGSLGINYLCRKDSPPKEPPSLFFEGVLRNGEVQHADPRGGAQWRKRA